MESRQLHDPIKAWPVVAHGPKHLLPNMPKGNPIESIRWTVTSAEIGPPITLLHSVDEILKARRMPKFEHEEDLNET